MNLRPIVKIHGGKYYSKNWILSLFPDNYERLYYYETHGGAGSVILNKKPGVRDTYNELDIGLFNIFWCLQYNTREFVEKINLLPYSEETFLAHQNKKTTLYDLESAIAEVVIRRMSRGGLKKTFSTSKRLRGGRMGDLNAWETFKLTLPIIAERVKNISLSNVDGTYLVSCVENKNSILYVDPPYFPATRTAKKVYDLEMNEKSHIKLLETILDCPAYVIVSGYGNELYNDILKDWRCEKKIMPNHSGQSKVKQTRTECLWLNY